MINENERHSTPSSIRELAISAALALVLAFVGCQRPAGADHENEEAHARPSHMPVSFVEAIPDLVRRLEGVKKTVAEEKTPAKETLNEIGDIVRWLPMLAGESDLRKADWDRVNQLSNELEKLVAPWFSGSESKVSPNVNIDPRCMAILESLQRLADKAKAHSETDWK